MRRILFNIPRHLVLAVDLLLCTVAFVLAYLLRFNFDLDNYIWHSVPYVLPLVIILKLIAFWYFRTYYGMLHHSSTQDLQRLFTALSLTNGLLLGAQLVTNKIFGNQNFIPISVILIDYIASLSMLAVLRIAAKALHYEWMQQKVPLVNVVIFGAGEIGAAALQSLQEEARPHYRVVSFLDDDARKQGRSLAGIPVSQVEDNLAEQLKHLEADLLILAARPLSPGRKNQILEACLAADAQVMLVPPAYKWINGELSFRQIREIRIEDVLGREPIQLAPEAVQQEVFDKVVLITGAAGSIGSELVRQIIPFKPRLLVLLDQAESALYDLELELLELYVKVNFVCVLGDIRDANRMEQLFREYNPQLVFHAAAYKHVPVMEENPAEAVPTNVTGTRVLADLAVKNRTEKFIYLSTDKAVNPTSVMGASKRLGEMYVQALDHYLRDSGTGSTRFIITRFGNVLGSTGSVIPRFRKQIDSGGPVTVTHPQITRYFMTIPEACQLVLEAAAMGSGGEVYLFDMGEPVRIVDLAKKMIRLSGMQLGKDIQLVFTGLRPGEKLVEELVYAHENVQPTHHPKIQKVNDVPHDYATLNEQLNQLQELCRQPKQENLIIRMKQLVPEYVSRNSVYEKLNVRKQ